MYREDTEPEEVRENRTGLAQRWCALKVLHDRIEAQVERALQKERGISVREFSLIEVLSRQHDGEGGHLTMSSLADSVALSQSATTRLVARLEERGLLNRYLCPTDRRGVYTDLTPAGWEQLEAARPINAAALAEALDSQAGNPELAPFLEALKS